MAVLLTKWLCLHQIEIDLYHITHCWLKRWREISIINSARVFMQSKSLHTWNLQLLTSFIAPCCTYHSNHFFPACPSLERTTVIHINWPGRTLEKLRHTYKRKTSIPFHQRSKASKSDTSCRKLSGLLPRHTDRTIIRRHASARKLQV